MDRANRAVNDQLKNIIKYFFVQENVYAYVLSLSIIFTFNYLLVETHIFI